MKLSPKDIARFCSKVDVKGKDECWPWKAGKVKSIYAQFWTNGKDIGAHRVSYQITYNKFDYKLCVCHKCDNPICVNPKHLFLGTRKDNNKDRDIKERTQKGINHWCARLTEKQVLEIRQKAKDLDNKGLFKKFTTKEIANNYDITETHARYIINNQNWSHI